MRMAMVESVDRAVFNGDNGANEDTADIVGMQTAGITESDLDPSRQQKGRRSLEILPGLRGWAVCASLGDVRIVTSVGANVLWHGSIHNAAADNQTIAQFLMASGLTWMARGGIDANTANGDFGAYIGLQRGVEGAGIAAVWEQAS